MRTLKLGHLVLVTLVMLLTSSCATLNTKGVAYQSVRAIEHKSLPVPEGCEILVVYQIDEKGKLHVTVNNLTDEIMIVDQTKSFFNTNGKSICYYDPTVRTTTNSNITSATKGASVNLGAIGSALGVGTLGGLLNGINVGGSGTNGTVQTNTTYIADQPQVGIAPKGSGTMSKVFPIGNILKNFPQNANNISPDDSFCKFSVCITYSTDEGRTFNKIVTDMYVNSNIYSPVKEYGMRNGAIQGIYEQKPDAVNEDVWFMKMYERGMYDNEYTITNHGVIMDYQ